jgi:hypothetical protein
MYTVSLLLTLENLGLNIVIIQACELERREKARNRV